MNARNFSLIFGILYLGLAILGMMPGMVRPLPADAPEIRFAVMQGTLFGLFPVNMLLTLVHLMIGAWGLGAFMGWSRARSYARGAAFLLATLGLMGMVQGLDTLFGLMPLYGHDVWLHLASAGAAAFFGWREDSGERRSLYGERRKPSRAPIAKERRQGMYDRRRSSYSTQA
jgi:hypothetical protein